MQVQLLSESKEGQREEGIIMSESMMSEDMHESESMSSRSECWVEKLESLSSS
jgi:hypothetical protein